MATRHGEVAQIWRYPVKSLGGERQARAFANEDGLAGDRGWALWDETWNHIASGKQHPGLMVLQGRFAEPDDCEGPVCVFDDGGRAYRSDDPWAAALLSAYIGCSIGFRRRPASGEGTDRTLFLDRRPARAGNLNEEQSEPSAAPIFPGDMDRLYGLYLTTPGLFADCSPLHILSTATLKSLAQIGGSDIADVRRYRPNLVLDLSHSERSLVGERIAIGGMVAQILSDTPRCSMPSQAQSGITQNWAVGAAIAAMPAGSVGVYADVLEPGPLAEGDAVRTLPKVYPAVLHPRYAMQPVDADLLERARREPPPAAPQDAQHPAVPDGMIAMRVVSTRCETDEVTSFRFEAADGRHLPRHLPGQHLRIVIASGGRTVSRSYTLSSSPLDSTYAISVKREAAGCMSRLLHDQVQPGAIIHASLPRGSFHIDPTSDAPLLFVTMGIGITPMISALRTLARTQPNRVVRVIHGASSLSSLPFLSELQNMAGRCPGLEITLLLSRERPPQEQADTNIAIQGGRITVDVIDAISLDGISQALICGTLPFNESVASRLLERAPDLTVSYELFCPPRALAVPDSRDVRVRFARTGLEAIWTGQDRSLLEFAERHGIAAPSDCRAGICKRCRCRIVGGEVAYFSEMLRPERPEDLLLCCSTANGSDLIIDL